MTSFLENFDQKKDEAIAFNASAEHRIIELLERIRVLSKSNLNSMPSEKGFQDLKGDLAIKEKEVKNSEMTVDAVLAGNFPLNLSSRERAENSGFGKG